MMRDLPPDPPERAPCRKQPHHPSLQKKEPPMPQERVMYDVGPFGMRQMLECASNLRASAANATSMEDAADSIIASLYGSFVDRATKTPCMALARLYKTHPYGDLPPDLKEFARSVFPEVKLTDATRCMTLLASRGETPAWSSRHESKGHRAIPLPSVDMVEQIPMIAQLVRQLGLQIASVVSPTPSLILDETESTFNVFHVTQALGSPFIPAQESFVVPYQIASVLGFGGLLPDGDMFACILFSKAPIGRDIADLFQAVALNVKLSILPFVGGRVFH
jgi:hypothetical protein